MIGEIFTGQAMKAAAEAEEGKPALVEVESAGSRVKAEVTGAGKNSVELESVTMETDGVLPGDSKSVIKALEPASGPLREIERQRDGTRVIRTPEPVEYEGEIEYSEVLLEEGGTLEKPVSRVTLRRLHRDDEGEARSVAFPVSRKDMARVIDDLEKAMAGDAGPMVD